MANTQNIFEGLSAFPITPAGEDGIVDTAALCRILERLDIPGVDSIGLLGSTGTYMYLAREQRKRALDAATRTLRGRKPLIVSVGAIRTYDVQNLVKDAEEAGANGLLLAPVSYNALTEEEVYQHYESVAGSTKLPLCIYNTPSTTHFTFTDALLARIAALPNVVALKQPAPITDAKKRHETLRAQLPSEFSIGYSADWLVAEPLLAGGSTWFSVIAGVLPEPSVALMNAIRKGDEFEVKRVSALFQPIWDLFKEFGDLRVAYALVNELDLCKAAPPRPILPIPAVHHDRIRSALATVNENMKGISG